MGYHHALDTTADEPLGKVVSRLLFEMTGRMRAHFEEVAASVDLTPMQSRALHHLDEPCPMGDVADRLRCDASNVTGIIDRLQERGLVERREDPSDRRRRLLVITPEGLEVRTAMVQRMIESHPILLGLDEDEQATLRDLLLKALAATPVPDATSAV